MSNKPVIFSFFSGCGFLDLGFEKAGYEVDFVNEYSSSFLSAYMYSREKMQMAKPKFGYHNTDINEYFDGRRDELVQFIFETRKAENLVGFIGGPPCPDFSVGGKNRGREGDNGKLSSSYINLIVELQPDFFLFENVKGLWKTKRHREFYEELKSKLHSSGYCTAEKLTNALEYGVAQDRDRILLFGVKKALLNPNFYLETQLLAFPWDRYVLYNTNQIKNTNWPNLDAFAENSFTLAPDTITKELTVQYWFDKNNVENHPNSTAFFIPRSGLSKMKIIQEGDVSKKSYKRLHRWRYSPTVAYGNNEVHLHPYKARRLSAAEAMAIQSLPKEFELPNNMSLSDMFKTIGNGVPFILAKGIASSIKEYLEVATCKE